MAIMSWGGGEVRLTPESWLWRALWSSSSSSSDIGFGVPTLSLALIGFGVPTLSLALLGLVEILWGRGAGVGLAGGGGAAVLA